MIYYSTYSRPLPVARTSGIFKKAFLSVDLMLFYKPTNTTEDFATKLLAFSLAYAIWF